MYRLELDDFVFKGVNGNVRIAADDLADPLAMSRFYTAEAEHVLDSDLPVKKKVKLVCTAVLGVEPVEPVQALELLREVLKLDPSAPVHGRIRSLEARVNRRG